MRTSDNWAVSKNHTQNQPGILVIKLPSKMYAFLGICSVAMVFGLGGCVLAYTGVTAETQASFELLGLKLGSTSAGIGIVIVSAVIIICSFYLFIDHEKIQTSTDATHDAEAYATDRLAWIADGKAWNSEKKALEKSLDKWLQFQSLEILWDYFFEESRSIKSRIRGLDFEAKQEEETYQHIAQSFLRTLSSLYQSTGSLRTCTRSHFTPASACEP